MSYLIKRTGSLQSSLEWAGWLWLRRYQVYQEHAAVLFPWRKPPVFQQGKSTTSPGNWSNGSCSSMMTCEHFQLSSQSRSVEHSQCDWEADRTQLSTDRCCWGHPPQAAQANIIHQSYQAKGTEHNGVNTHKTHCTTLFLSQKQKEIILLPS